LAGTCVYCKNLEGKNFGLNDEICDTARCSKGKYDKDNLECYYSKRQIARQCKSVMEIQDKCDSYEVDYRFSPKSQS